MIWMMILGGGLLVMALERLTRLRTSAFYVSELGKLFSDKVKNNDNEPDSQYVNSPNVKESKTTLSSFKACTEIPTLAEVECPAKAGAAPSSCHLPKLVSKSSRTLVAMGF
jgi:hypothetical protein